MIYLIHLQNQGIKIGGRRLHVIKFADDQILLADSGKTLSEIISKLNAVMVKYGMKIDTSKIKVMVIG